MARGKEGGAGRKWTKGRKMGISVIVSTIKIKLKKRSTNWLLHNGHGDGKHSMGNTVNNILISM